MSLARATGSPSHITVGGKTYAIKIDMGVIGELEQWMLARRKNPLEIARANLAGLDTDMKKYLLDRALERAIEHRAVSFEDVGEFMSSREGVSVIFWINMRRDSPGMAFEEAERLIATLSDEEIAKAGQAIARAGGVDELGNSTGPTPDLDPHQADATVETGIGSG